MKHRHKGALHFWTRHRIHAGQWIYKEVELWQRQIPAATPTARTLHPGTAPCTLVLHSARPALTSLHSASPELASLHAARPALASLHPASPELALLHASRSELASPDLSCPELLLRVATIWTTADFCRVFLRI